MVGKKVMAMLLAASMVVPGMSAFASEGGTQLPDIEEDIWGKYDETVTLTVACALNSSVKFDESDPDRRSIEENIWRTAEEKYLGINLDYIWTPTSEQYNSKWNAALATGDIPDIAVVDSVIYGQLVEAGLVADMTEIFDEYASDTYKKLCEEDNWLTYNTMIFDGKLLGIPYLASYKDQCNLMFIRKDWLDQVGKEVPTTVAELEDVMKAFRDANLGGEDTLGLGASKSFYTGTNSIDAMFEAYGAFYNIWVEDGNGGLQYSNTTDEMREALLELQKLYSEGYIRQDFASLDSTAAAEDVAAGKLGIVFGKYWTTLTTVGESIKNDENADWICVDVPTVDGSPFISCAQDADPTSFIFVNANCEHPEAAVKLVNFWFGYAKELGTGSSKILGTTEDGVEVFKYAFPQGSASTTGNMDASRVICEVLDTGDTSLLIPDEEHDYTLTYEQIVRGMEGNREDYCYTMVFGHGSAYELINKMTDEGRIITTSYMTLPTQTMMDKSEDLKTNLDAAMQKVIMGEDISVYDEAVETWYSTGGDVMTQEASDWFASRNAAE